MQQAISFAKDAAVHNDVPVGALVVNEQGEILGTGHNLREEDNDCLLYTSPSPRDS